MAQTSPLTPTQRWQALVPELRPSPAGGPASPADTATDTAERLLLLLHYSIDWTGSFLSNSAHRKTYWDDLLPSRVRRAAYRSATLDQWWSSVASSLDASDPVQRERRLELAALLREPALPVLGVFQTSLPALVLRVRIIAEAVAAQRKADSE